MCLVEETLENTNCMPIQQGREFFYMQQSVMLQFPLCFGARRLPGKSSHFKRALFHEPFTFDCYLAIAAFREIQTYEWYWKTIS